MGWTAPPAHELPAGHSAQVPAVAMHALDVTLCDAYPAVHVHATRWKSLPAHELPAPHGPHGAVVSTHAVTAPGPE